MSGKIKSNANKIKTKKKTIRIIKIALLIIMLLLLVAYIVISVVYNSGSFSISLDKNLYLKSNILIYDDSNYKVFRTDLYAKTIDEFDNISYKWLPKTLDDSDGGSHNGDNYIAYTFYIENLGEQDADYWSELVITDSVKNVDKAVRVKVYKNGIETTYAKIGSDDNPEKGTIPFESDDLIMHEHVENFTPGSKDKYTIVIWLEGSDPDCTDNILGGEIKIQMNFNSEFINRQGE